MIGDIYELGHVHNSIAVFSFYCHSHPSFRGQLHRVHTLIIVLHHGCVAIITRCIISTACLLPAARANLQTPSLIFFKTKNRTAVLRSFTTNLTQTVAINMVMRGIWVTIKRSCDQFIFHCNMKMINEVLRFHVNLKLSSA